MLRQGRPPHSPFLEQCREVWTAERGVSSDSPMVGDRQFWLNSADAGRKEIETAPGDLLAVEGVSQP